MRKTSNYSTEDITGGVKHTATMSTSFLSNETEHKVLDVS